MVSWKRWRTFALMVALLFFVELLPIAEHLGVINTRAFWIISLTLVGIAIALAVWEMVALIIEWRRLKQEGEQLRKLNEAAEKWRQTHE